MNSTEKPIVEKTVDLGKKTGVMIDENQKDQRQDHGAVEDYQGLAPTRIDAWCKKTTDKQPDQNGKEDKITYEESKGQKIEHGQEKMACFFQALRAGRDGGI